MPTPAYFSRCPEFPADVPVADIPAISFDKLRSGSSSESERLYEACQEHGFFLLDLQDSEEGAILLHDAERMFDLAKNTFELGQPVLEEYASKPPKDLLGYKRTGVLKTAEGAPDVVEMYTLGQDDIMGNGTSREYPDTIENSRECIQGFFRRSHETIEVCLAQLDKHLGLELGTLAALCPLDKLSHTSLRLVRSPLQPDVDFDRVSLPSHTDIGAITLLFHVAGGLQILPAGKSDAKENWRFIRPRPNCALVSIGDTLVEMTGGVLRSNLHRVVTAPGEQSKVPRTSLAYLVRPQREASMRRLKSDKIPPLGDGEEEVMQSVTEWAVQRTKEIMQGKLYKVETRRDNPQLYYHPVSTDIPDGEL